jgi:hypothetical protein
LLLNQIDWNKSDQADVIIYARKGSWFGVQNDKDAWPHVIVNTTIYRPADFPNRDITGPYISVEHKMKSAMIPEWAFKPLTIKQGETWALYVLTSVPDFRYTMGNSIGQVFSSTPELDILEGAGAADYPAFGSGLEEFGGVEYTFYAPRVFNGNLRYDYFAECPSYPPSISFAPSPMPVLKTSVSYMFYVEHGPEIAASNVPGDMERGVRNVLDGFLVDTTNDLYELVINDGFFISSISGGVVPPAKLGCKCSYFVDVCKTAMLSSSFLAIISLLSRFVCANSSKLVHPDFCGSGRQPFPVCFYRTSRILPLPSSQHFAFAN